MNDLMDKYTFKKLLVYPGMLMVMLLAYAGCDKECQEDEVETYYMPDSQKAMVPYETGDTLVFLYGHNGQKDTITFTGKKERKFEENEEMITDCPSYRIEKYEQFHYNFYSKDSVHHLRMVADYEKKLDDGLDINFNDNVIYGVATNKFDEYFLDKKGSDTLLYYNTVNHATINSKNYNKVYVSISNTTNKKIMYNKKYGVLLLRQNNKIWSLLKFK